MCSNWRSSLSWHLYIRKSEGRGIGYFFVGTLNYYCLRTFRCSWFEGLFLWTLTFGILWKFFQCRFDDFTENGTQSFCAWLQIKEFLIILTNKNFGIVVSCSYLFGKLSIYFFRFSVYSNVCDLCSCFMVNLSLMQSCYGGVINVCLERVFLIVVSDDIT